MGSTDRKLRGFLLARSPAWLTELDRALRVDDGVEWEDAWSLGRHGRLSRRWFSDGVPSRA
ncbi:MAG: hypothetical protein ACRDRH_11340 [Pseudonocardia sp.]